MDIGFDARARLELLVEDRGRPDPVEAEAPRGVALGVEGVEIPALLAVQELVRLDAPGGELVLVLLVVLEVEQAVVRDRPAHHLRHLRVVAGGGRDLEALNRRVAAERGHDLLARRRQRALRDVLAQEVDRGDERLCLEREQASGLGEIVAVRLRVDLDLVAVHLGVDHVAAAAEVHDVQQVDVLAQLGVGELETLAHLVRVQSACLAGGLDQDPGERDEPGEALRPDRRLLLAVRVGVGLAARRLAARALHGSGLERHLVPLDDQRDPLAGLLGQLRRAQDAGALTEAEDPRDDLARVGVLGLEDETVFGGVVGVCRRDRLPGVAEVALHEPVDPVGNPDPGGPGRIAELPVGARGVDARIEVLRRREVVLGLGGVAHLAAYPREAENADVLSLVGVADQVELPAAEEQVVRIDLPLALRVPGHRVVVEDDRLAAEDRGLDLGEPLREVAATRAGRHAERHRAMLGRRQRRRLAPRELLQRQPHRLGVGELAVEERERRSKGAELGIGELDRREVEVLRRKRVVLGLVVALGGLVDLQLDPERLELRAVGVEAAGESVVVHARVALHLLLDLEGRDRTPLRHQERDQ